MNLFSSLIFSDSYSGQSNELATNRTLASIPFAGRFRLVDFTLSALVNAGVSNVAVITKSNYASLQDHLGDGKYWDLNHRNSGLRLLSPFFRSETNNEAFMARGKLDALRSVQKYIASIKEEYVVLSNANVVANVDFDSAFDQHISSGADITCIYANLPSDSQSMLKLELDGTSVKAMTYAQVENKTVSASLNIYLMKRDLLLDIIREADTYDHYIFEKYALINNVGKLDIRAFEHKDYARIIRNVNDYYQASVDMLDADIRAEVFKSDSPVMTRVKDSVPALYHYNANIENSLIADGCHIDGTVKNSIIFRNVTIETGAVVENSIIMQNSVIGKNSTLNCVILDKDVTVSENKILCGAAEYPYVFKKNTKI